jgi:hypothetical protein
MKIETYRSWYLTENFLVTLGSTEHKRQIADFFRCVASGVVQIVIAASIGLIAGSLSGCSSLIIPVSGEASADSGAVDPIATGNWQFNLTSSSGAALFPYLSGYLREDSAGNYVDAELTETSSSGCFIGTNAISADGTVSGTALTLDSFSVNDQFLEMNGTMNATGSSMTGTYSVSGGCAAGDSGTFTGALYSQLTGTYTGSIDNASSSETISLKLQQNSSGNGNGVLLVAGTATFSGISDCFTSGTIVAPAGYISGNMTQLVFTDTNGNAIQLKGSIDAAADTLTLSSIAMISGSCAGTSYGTATLKS